MAEDEEIKPRRSLAPCGAIGAEPLEACQQIGSFLTVWDGVHLFNSNEVTFGLLTGSAARPLPALRPVGRSVVNAHFLSLAKFKVRGKGRSPGKERSTENK